MRIIDRRNNKLTTPDDWQAKEPIKIFPCEYRGEKTGDKATCNSCSSRGRQVDVYQCSIHGTCTADYRATGVQWCKRCPVFQEQNQ